MTQCDVILKAMLTNKSKKWWSAKDFQYGENFVGYEASSRMSEILNKYGDLIDVAKDGRFRIISINWNNKEVKNLLEKYDLI